jgi:predicted small integral membrane protein
LLTVLELRYPGGAERKGAFGLVTTRGDRLFITLLGSVYIFLAWLGLFGLPLWVPLGLALAWATFCFWKV